MKFSSKDFFSKYHQFHRKLWIWLHLLKKSLMENFIFCTVLLLEHFLIFFIIYLAAPQTTLGHCRGGSLTNPMSAFYLFRRESHQEPRNYVES